jgi:hypothetical protein
LTVKEREVRERADRLDLLETETAARLSLPTRRTFYSLIRKVSLDSFWMKLLCFWFLMCSIITVFSYKLFRANDFLRSAWICCNFHR